MLGLRGHAAFAEFMPDADDFAGRGHSPLAGLLILAIALVLGGLIAWSAIAQVEQVIRAPGRVEPAGRVKVINHPNGGRIATIHIEDGQRVQAGDALVAFDPELIESELGELLGRYQVLAAAAARLGAEASGGDDPAFDGTLAAARPDLIEEQSALLAERLELRASQIETLAQTVERRSREVKAFAADVARLRNSYELLRQQVDAVRALAERGLYPRLRMVELERQLDDVAGEIAKARERLNASEAALAEAQSRQSGFEREWRAEVLAELANVKAERDRLAESIKRERTLMRNLVVRAPVAGIIQDLAVTGSGQSVGSNQPLMKLVPTGGGLVITAKVANKDIGYVREALPARIKVQAYDFLRYGTLDGTIARVAADASSDPAGGPLSYEVTVVTEHDRLRFDGKELDVVPGMAVDVDLLIGERTILSYLTDRIFRLKETAFRQG